MSGYIVGYLSVCLPPLRGGMCEAILPGLASCLLDGFFLCNPSKVQTDILILDEDPRCALRYLA